VDYGRDGHRCDLCRAANARYEQRRKRDRAYGRNRLADAAPVRAHLAALAAAGLGRRRIAELSGVRPNVIQSITHGRRNRPPNKQVQRETAVALLAVPLDWQADKAVVPALATHRRLQALVHAGWSQARLAALLGVTLSNFLPMFDRVKVTAGRARAVEELYETLWDVPPPSRTAHERGAITRARNLALRNGWEPAMAWDADNIHLPRVRRSARPV
jgi:transcriptional regulator with XRE-family HTH domain